MEDETPEFLQSFPECLEDLCRVVNEKEATCVWRIRKRDETTTIQLGNQTGHSLLELFLGKSCIDKKRFLGTFSREEVHQ